MNLLKQLVLAAIVSVSASAAHADIITFNLAGSINGTAPSNANNPSWLSATFTDTAAGKVELVMMSTLPSGEYVDNWLFNVNSSVTGLTASHSAGYEWGSAVYQQTNGSNAIKGGIFDLGFGSSNANASRFASNGTSVYELSGIGLSAASFLTLSAKDGMNMGGYYSAAEIKGIGNGKSGSIGTTVYTLTEIKPPVTPKPPTDVPEPGSISLLGIGLLGLALRRLKR